MKECNLLTFNDYVPEKLNEVLPFLQKYELLKNAYIEDNFIKCSFKFKHFAPDMTRKDEILVSILKIDYVNGKLFYNNKIGWFENEMKLEKKEVFEVVGRELEVLKIKEPLPHQARKKTLEELDIGDSYYSFEYEHLLSSLTINNKSHWKKETISSCGSLENFKNRLKYLRLLIALDEEEIKNKVLD